MWKIEWNETQDPSYKVGVFWGDPIHYLGASCQGAIDSLHLAEAWNDDASLPAGGGNMIYALEIFTKNKSHSLSFTSSLSLR